MNIDQIVVLDTLYTKGVALKRVVHFDIHRYN